MKVRARSAAAGIASGLACATAFLAVNLVAPSATTAQYSNPGLPGYLQDSHPGLPGYVQEDHPGHDVCQGLKHGKQGFIPGFWPSITTGFYDS